MSSSLTCGPYESAVSMKFTPSSTARRRTAFASSRSGGGPQMPRPVIRIAPKPRRLTVRSPPTSMVPASPALRGRDSDMVPTLPAGNRPDQGPRRRRRSHRVSRGAKWSTAGVRTIDGPTTTPAEKGIDGQGVLDQHVHRHPRRGPAGLVRAAGRAGDDGGRRAVPGPRQPGRRLRGGHHPAHHADRVPQRGRGRRDVRSPAYQEALRVLGDAAEREIRIIEAVD